MVLLCWCILQPYFCSCRARDSKKKTRVFIYNVDISYPVTLYTVRSCASSFDTILDELMHSNFLFGSQSYSKVKTWLLLFFYFIKLEILWSKTRFRLSFVQHRIIDQKSAFDENPKKIRKNPKWNVQSQISRMYL